MMTRTRIQQLAATAACCAALTQMVHGSGIILYEIATPDVGLASAGSASRAEDASTLFKNPAGMSRLEGAQFQGGLQALYGSVSFNADAQTSTKLGAEEGGNAVGWLPGASAFAVIPLGEKFRVGLGSLSYFGLAEDYADDWVGRYYVQDSALLGMSLMPTLSYEVTDWLAVGAGLNAMYGYLNADVAVNNLVGKDGRMSLEDRTWGFGANVGVLLTLNESTRLGVTYLSPVDLDFRDKPHFSDLGTGLEALLSDPSVLDLGVTVPQSVMVSAYHALNDTWALMADVGWQDWSEFGYVQVGVEEAGTRTLDLNYQDTWHVALGAQYRASAKWVLLSGVAYDSAPVKNADRTVTLPMGQLWRFGLGAQYQASETIRVGAAFNFQWAGDMAVDQGTHDSLRGRVSGSFDDTWFTFANVNLNWSF